VLERELEEQHRRMAERRAQAAGVARVSILRTNGLFKRSLHSASSMTRRGKRSRRVRESFGRAIA
jgi:hypothetical protein